MTGLFAAGMGQQPLPAVTLPGTQEPRLIRLWHSAIPSTGTPAANEASVFAMASDGRVVALDRRDGSLQWATPSARNAATTDVVAANHDVVVVAGADVLALGATDGRPRWRFGDGAIGHFFCSASQERNAIYCGTSSGEALALDAGEGRLQWRSALEQGATTIYRPLVSGGSLFMGFTHYDKAASAGVISLDAESGRPRWRHQFALPRGARFAGGPAATGRWIFAADSKGGINQLDADTGVARARRAPIDPSVEDHRALAVCGDTVVAASLTGVVEAFRPTIKKDVWRFQGRHLGSAGFTVGCSVDTLFVPYMKGVAVVCPRTGVFAQLMGTGAANPLAPLVEGATFHVAGSEGVGSWLIVGSR